MATVNKDFKIKSGLIVEGTTATVNGNQVLTENASDQYIIDIIGGETLVTSVNAGQLEVVNGELSVKSGVFDAEGAADTAEQNAKNYADGLAVNYDAAGSASAAQSAAQLYADGVANTAEQNAKNYADGLASNYDASGSATTAENNAKFYADGLIADLGGSGTASVNGNIDVLTGTGIQVNGGNNSVEIDRQTVDTWYDASGAAATAEQNANLYTDNAVSDLVNGAPELLDTLNELAAALQDNPDVITDLQDIAAGKQDTLTAGSNIDITGATISVTGLDTADVVENSVTGGLYFTPQRALDATASAYDVAGSASTAQQNAENYADGLAVNYDSAGSAFTAEQNANTYTNSQINALTTDDIEEGVNNLYYTDSRAKDSAVDLLTNANLTNIQIQSMSGQLYITAENGVADSTTDDLAEGETNLYFTNQRVYDAIDGQTITPLAVSINNYRKEEATQQYVASASTVNVHSFAYPYESAKYLVRVVGWDGGVKHSQITEILVTVDGNNNIAMTEYGNVHTGTNPLATFSATYNVLESSYKLTASTAVSGCEIIAAATMLSWAD